MFRINHPHTRRLHQNVIQHPLKKWRLTCSIVNDLKYYGVQLLQQGKDRSKPTKDSTKCSFKGLPYHMSTTSVPGGPFLGNLAGKNSQNTALQEEQFWVVIWILDGSLNYVFGKLFNFFWIDIIAYFLVTCWLFWSKKCIFEIFFYFLSYYCILLGYILVIGPFFNLFANIEYFWDNFGPF